MARSKVPDAPAGFADAGSELWEKVLGSVPEAFELDDRELAILSAACRQADDVARLEIAVGEDGPMTTGSQGQPVLHPAIVEARQGRLALSRLLGQLQIPDEDDEPRSLTSARAKRAADVRWRRREVRRGSA